MFSKLNIKQLAGIFIVLLLLVFIVRFFDNKNNNNRSFKSELVAFNEEDLATIEVHSRADFDNPYTYFQQDNEWMVEKSGQSYTASTDVVKSMISTLNDLRAERVAANSKDKWSEFQVNDSTGTRVIAKSVKGKTIADIYVGKFNYTQPKNPQQNPYNQQGKITSFVRLSDENEVYAVNGYIAMAFDRDLKYVRESKIISSAAANWNKVSVSHPGDSSFVLEKNNNKWLMNGAIADSASVQSFLKGIERLNSTNFYDEPVNLSPAHTVLIEGNAANPVEIKGYYIGDKKVINSSENKNTWFYSEDDDIFEKLFASKPQE